MSVINDLKAETKGREVKFVYFAGSWCPMCLVSTPKVMGMLNSIEIPVDNIEVHSVNPQKTEPRASIKQYGISRVPTLVIEERGQEIGRITEYTEDSWEEDTLSILRNPSKG